MQKIMNLLYDFGESSLFDIHDLNSSFAQGRLKIMYTGKNRNKTDISREAVECALPSLLNVPIVCHWDYEAGEIGGHDIEVVSDKDGNLRIRNLTEPCGVVPEHAEYEFSVEEDENGNEHEYLVVNNVILWKRQDCYNHIVNDLDGRVNHSMEITVKNGRSQNGVYCITDFEFTALCLLERDEPCFEGSELTLFSANHFEEKMNEMMREFKETFSLVGTSQEDNYKCSQEQSMEGGNKVLDNNKTVDFDENEIDKVEEPVSEPAEEPVVEPETDSDEEPVVEEPTAEPDAEPAEEPVEEPSDEPMDNIDTEDFALQRQVESELEKMLCNIKISDEYGEFLRYWMVDYDVDKNMVYCMDCVDGLLYGFPYELNGDAVSIDFECKKRMKWAIEEFEDTSSDPNMSALFASVLENAKYKVEAEAKYQEASNTISVLETELNELKEFKASVDNASMKQERDSVLSNFSDLENIEEFELLKTECMNYSVSDLEEKCYAIRGRHLVANKFSVQPKSPKLFIPHSEGESNNDEPYGGVVKHYLNK